MVQKWTAPMVKTSGEFISLMELCRTFTWQISTASIIWNVKDAHLAHSHLSTYVC